MQNSLTISLSQTDKLLPSILKYSLTKDTQESIGLGKSVFGGVPLEEMNTTTVMKSKHKQPDPNRANLSRYATTMDNDDITKKRMYSLGLVSSISQTNILETPLNKKNLLIPIREIDPHSFVKKEKYSAAIKTYSHKSTDTQEDFKSMLSQFAIEKESKEHELQMLLTQADKNILTLDQIITQKREFESKTSTDVSQKLKEMNKTMSRRYCDSELYLMSMVQQVNQTEPEERDFTDIARDLEFHVKLVQRSTAQRIFRLANTKMIDIKQKQTPKQVEITQAKKKPAKKVDMLENMMNQKQHEVEKKTFEMNDIVTKFDSHDSKLQHLYDQIEHYKAQINEMESQRYSEVGQKFRANKKNEQACQAQFMDPMMNQITQQLQILMVENNYLRDELEKQKQRLLEESTRLLMPKSMEETLMMILKSDMSNEEMLIAVQELLSLQRLPSLQEQTRPQDMMDSLRKKMESSRTPTSALQAEEGRKFTSRFAQNKSPNGEEMDIEEEDGFDVGRQSAPDLNLRSQRLTRSIKTEENEGTSTIPLKLMRTASQNSVLGKKTSKFGAQAQKGSLAGANLKKTDTITLDNSAVSRSRGQSLAQNGATVNQDGGGDKKMVASKGNLISQQQSPNQQTSQQKQQFSTAGSSNPNSPGLSRQGSLKVGHQQKGGENLHKRNRTVHEVQEDDEEKGSEKPEIFSEEEEVIDAKTGVTTKVRVKKQMVETMETYVDENGQTVEHKVLKAVSTEKAQEMLQSGQASAVKKKARHVDEDTGMSSIQVKVNRNARLNSDQSMTLGGQTDGFNETTMSLYSPDGKLISDKLGRKERQDTMTKAKRFEHKEIDDVISEEEEVIDEVTGERRMQKVKKQYIEMEEEVTLEDGSKVKKLIKRAVPIEEAQRLIESGQATKIVKQVTVELSFSDQSQDNWLEPAEKKRIQPDITIKTKRSTSKNITVSTSTQFTQTPPQLLKEIIMSYMAKLNLSVEQQESLKRELIKSDLQHEKAMMLSEKRQQYASEEEFLRDFEQINKDIEVKLMSQQYISTLGLNETFSVGGVPEPEQTRLIKQKQQEEYMFTFQSIKHKDKDDQEIYQVFETMDLNNAKMLTAEGTVKKLWERLNKSMHHEKVQELMERIKQHFKKPVDQPLSYGEFKKFYSMSVQQHKPCGESCVHLQRFFKLLGFETLFYLKRKEIKPIKQALSPF